MVWSPAFFHRQDISHLRIQLDPGNQPNTLYRPRELHYHTKIALPGATEPTSVPVETCSTVSTTVVNDSDSRVLVLATPWLWKLSHCRHSLCGPCVYWSECVATRHEVNSYYQQLDLGTMIADSESYITARGN